jgi:hypothetical protein
MSIVSRNQVSRFEGLVLQAMWGEKRKQNGFVANRSGMVGFGFFFSFACALPGLSAQDQGRQLS